MKMMPRWIDVCRIPLVSAMQVMVSAHASAQAHADLHAAKAACAPLFAALIARGDLSLADRRERLRLAIAAANTRLAQTIGGDLPGNERITAREFSAVERDPMQAVQKAKFDWKTPGGRELALYALERAARRNAADAHDGWLKWR